MGWPKRRVSGGRLPGAGRSFCRLGAHAGHSFMVVQRQPHQSHNDPFSSFHPRRDFLKGFLRQVLSCLWGGIEGCTCEGVPPMDLPVCQIDAWKTEGMERGVEKLGVRFLAPRKIKRRCRWWCWWLWYKFVVVMSFHRGWPIDSHAHQRRSKFSKLFRPSSSSPQITLKRYGDQTEIILFKHSRIPNLARPQKTKSSCVNWI